ncbi:MAG: hypothetical protein CVU07_10980 [Bacteroidetes bacterium HGW-Bacteroidetes-23]|nr:MAG: hypothetical protein CVU07_10980 [Bacteroidetes bacterium HGW-Bacteroidetes-23]
MDIFNYILKITTNADKVTASIDRLDAEMVNIQKASVNVDKAFGNSFNNIDNNLKRISFTSLIQQVNAVADGLNSLNAPGFAFDSSLADLQAITGVTNAKLKELGDNARDNAKTFGVVICFQNTCLPDGQVSLNY